MPLKIPQIHAALASIRQAIPSKVKLHLLGFGKIEHLAEFEQYGIASFDTTSPLVRAFKDAVKNYFSRDTQGQLSYYTAIRVPQARDNNKLKAKARRGVLNQEVAMKLEAAALDSIRTFAGGKMPIEPALDNILAYWKALNWREDHDDASQMRSLAKQRAIYHRTLTEQPWTRCNCRVCTEGGVETLLFRSSNRNKRRGFHNLHVFYEHLLAHRHAA